MCALAPCNAALRLRSGGVPRVRVRAPAAASRRAPARAPRLRVAAASPPNDGGAKPPFLRNILKVQLSKEEAASLSQSMRELGLDSAAKVRSFLLKRSAVQVLYLLSDIGINFGASIASFATFSALLHAEDAMPGPLRFTLCGVTAFGGGWFLTTVAADLVLLSMTAVVSLRYGLAADAFLELVRSGGSGGDGSSASAGPQGALFDSTRAAGAALAAAGSLDAAMRTLQAREAELKPDTATSLASYFTLRAAEEQRGFRPEALQLSERDALDVARAFQRYDANDDGAIDANELRALMIEVGGGDAGSVSVEQARAALRTLDSDGDGMLSYEEFARWWQQAKAQQEQQQQKSAAAATAKDAESS